LLTQHFPFVIAAALAVPLAAFVVVVAAGAFTLEDASTFVDAVVKIMVAVVGTGWALNRYFTTRTDETHLRFEATAELVVEPETGSDPSYLLIYRVELYNPAHVLFDEYDIELELTRVGVNEHREPDYEVIGRLARHPGNPIEPGSWSAISDVIVLRHDVRVVRMFVAVYRKSGNSWTWHRLLRVQPSPGPN
jgi:hypothetical protein